MIFTFKENNNNNYYFSMATFQFHTHLVEYHKNTTAGSFVKFNSICPPIIPFENINVIRLQILPCG